MYAHHTIVCHDINLSRGIPRRPISLGGSARPWACLVYLVYINHQKSTTFISQHRNMKTIRNYMKGTNNCRYVLLPKTLLQGHMKQHQIP